MGNANAHSISIKIIIFIIILTTTAHEMWICLRNVGQTAISRSRLFVAQSLRATHMIYVQIISPTFSGTLSLTVQPLGLEPATLNPIAKSALGCHTQKRFCNITVVLVVV